MTFLKKNSSDLLISLVLMVCTLFYAARFVDFSIPPFEDAAYAHALRPAPRGRTWHRLEHQRASRGWRDRFSFHGGLCAFHQTWLHGRAVGAWTGFAAYLLTVLIIYWENPRIHHASIPLSFLTGSTSLLALDFPRMRAAYFGTSFFALASASTLIFKGFMKEKRSTFWVDFPPSP